jgi:tetratricopeptide (TPR) repeat protein
MRGVVLAAWADLEVAASHLEEGARQYLEALEWMRAAQRAHPANPVFLERLGSTLCNFGSVVSEAEHDDSPLNALVSAEELLAEAVDVYSQLSEQYPKTVRYREALSASCSNLCAHLTILDRATEARAYGERALAECEQLVEFDPISPERHSAVGSALNNLAMSRLISGEPAAALELLERAVTSQEEALSRAPNSQVFRGHLARHLVVQSEALLALERWRDAAAMARRVTDVEVFEYWRWTKPATLLLDCAGAAEADLSLSNTERAQEREALRDEAVRMLATAVSEGLDPSALTRTPLFESLRDHEGFRELAQIPHGDQ